MQIPRLINTTRSEDNYLRELPDDGGFKGVVEIIERLDNFLKECKRDRDRIDVEKNSLEKEVVELKAEIDRLKDIETCS